MDALGAPKQPTTIPTDRLLHTPAMQSKGMMALMNRSAEDPDDEADTHGVSIMASAAQSNLFFGAVAAAAATSGVPPPPDLKDKPKPKSRAKAKAQPRPIDVDDEADPAISDGGAASPSKRRRSAPAAAGGPDGGMPPPTLSRRRKTTTASDGGAPQSSSASKKTKGEIDLNKLGAKELSEAWVCFVM